MKKLFELKKSEKGEKRRKPPSFLVPAVILTTFVAVGSAGYFKSIQDAANHVTVSFETNGGQDISSVVVDKGTAMENVPLADRENSLFEGWWYDEQLTQPYFDDDKLEKDTVLYASYQDSEGTEDTDEVYMADNLYLEDCDSSAPLVIHSENEITEDNLSDYLTVDSYLGDIPDGFTVTSLGNGDYEVVPNQDYKAGCTYDFTVLNGASFVSEEGENITEISQRIHKDESEVVELKNDIVYLDWDDVIRNGSDYQLYIPQSDEYTLTENTPLCMIDGYNEWVADGSNEDTFAPLFEENSLFITVESVSCDFTEKTISGQTISGDSWYYIEARDGELADILSDVDVYEEFEVSPEEMIDIEELEQQIAESDGIQQMEDLLTCAILEDERFLELASESSDEQFSFLNPITVSAEGNRMFRDGLEMNNKKGVKIPARKDMTVSVYWSSGNATNPNFPGIDKNDPENKKWSALQIAVTFEKEIKGINIQATIDITEYMKVTMQGYKDWNGLKLDFDYAANMYTQTNFDFSVKIWTGDKWEDISDTINSSLASDEIVAKYQQMIGAKEDGYIEIVDTPLFKTKYIIAPPIPIFSVNLNLNYVLKFNLAAGITSDFTYLDATQVGMRGKTYGDDKGLESYKHEILGANRYAYDLNVCGYLGVKTGIRGELTLSFNGLETLGEVGIAIELGVYADFYGYMNLHIAKPQQFYSNVEKSFSGGYFIEMGIYLEVKLIARSQAFGAEAGLMLLDLKFPLFSFGQRYVPCDLFTTNDKYLLNKNEGDIFEICGISAECMDMKTGNIVKKDPSSFGAVYALENDDAFYTDYDKMKLCIDGENSKKKTRIFTVKIYSYIPTMNNAGQGYSDVYYCGSTKVYWADPSLNINSIDEFQNKTVTATYCLKLPDDSLIEIDSAEVKVSEPMDCCFDYRQVFNPTYRSVYDIEDRIYTDDKEYDSFYDTFGEYLTEDTVFYRDVVAKKQFYVYFVYYDSNEKCWKGEVGLYNAGETPVPPEAAQNTPEMTGWSGYDNARGESLSEIKELSEDPEECRQVHGVLGETPGNCIKTAIADTRGWAVYNTERCFDVVYEDGSKSYKNPDTLFAQEYVAQYKDCSITFNYEGEEELLSTSVTVPFGEKPTLPDIERFVDRVGKIVGWDTDGDFEMDVEYDVYGNIKFPEVHEDGMIYNALYDQPEVTINLMNYNAETGQYEDYSSFKAKSKQKFTFDGEEVLLDGEKVFLDGDETDIFSQMLDSLPSVCSFKYWEIAKIETYNWDNPQEYTLQRFGYRYYIRPHIELVPTYTFIPAEGTKFTINPDSENPEEVDSFTKKLSGDELIAYSWKDDFDYWVFTGNEDETTFFAGWDIDDDGVIDYKYGDLIEIKADSTFKAVLQTNPIILNVNITSPVALDFPESVADLITEKKKDSEYIYVFEGTRSEYNEMMSYIDNLSDYIDRTDEETGYEYHYYVSESYFNDQFYFVDGETKTFKYKHDITISESIKGHTVTFNAGEGGYFRNNDGTKADSFSIDLLNDTYNINDFTIYASTSPRHDGGLDTSYVVDYWTDENGNVVPNNEFTVSKGGREFTAHWKYQVSVMLHCNNAVGGFEVGADYSTGTSMWITEGKHTYDELIKPVQTALPTALYEVTGWKDSRDSEDIVHSLDEELVIGPYDELVQFTAVWEETGARLFFNTYGFVDGTGENLAPGHNFNADNKVLLPYGTYKVSDFPVMEDTESDVYTFHTIGWKDEEGTVYSLDDPDAEIVLDKPIELEPIIVFSKCEVTFSGGGGRFSNNSLNITEKLEVREYNTSEFPVPTRENSEYEEYTFAGWDVYPSDYTLENFTLKPGDTFDMQQTCYTITALWDCTELKHHYEYAYDENEHWLVCINDGCTETAEPEKTAHSVDENGYCSECGYGYEIPPLNNGTYEISSAAQLYGFAKLVNDNTDTDAKFNAVLMNDITVNENVIDEAGNLVGDKLISWTPIGKAGVSYSGKFDGNGYSISGLYYNDNGFGSGKSYAGLFAYLYEAEIRNLTVDDSYFEGLPYSGYAGGIAAIADSSVISASESNATVIGMDAGGICAEAPSAEIKNCLFSGKIIGEFRASGISSSDSQIENCLNNGKMIVSESCEAYSISNSSTIVNSIYNAELCGLAPVPVTAGREISGLKDEQIRSGEAAYILAQGAEGSVWGQTIGTDEMPVPNGETVYKIAAYEGCEGLPGDVTYCYSNTNSAAIYAPHSYVNGICSECQGFEPAEDTDNDGYYEIDNAGKLYWFAQEVKNGNAGINAVLTNNITVNKGENDGDVANCNGKMQNGWIYWTPVGSESAGFTGSFDGQGHTVSGLYFVNNGDENGGLFGVNNGSISNVGVIDSYFNAASFAGGICGQNKGTVTNCYFTGTVKGNGSLGGICGSDDSTIENCYYLSVSETEDGGRTCEQFASGEVAYLLSQGTNGSVWGQTIGTDDYPVAGGKKVLTNVDASQFANDIIIYGQNATLDGTIGFNIYISADDSYEWDKAFGSVTGVKNADGQYVFTFNVAAKDMNKAFRLVVDDKIDAEVSVSKYLAELSGSDNAELKNLADSMSAYGDAAEAYFGGGTVAEQTVIDDLSSYDFTVGTMPEGISYYGSSLILESETTVRHYFTLTEGNDIASFTFKVGDEAVTPAEKQGYYYIDVKNISAEKLGTSFNVSVNGEEVITDYSALSYANKVIGSESADDNLKNLVKALYLYNKYALAYISANAA